MSIAIRHSRASGSRSNVQVMDPLPQLPSEVWLMILEFLPPSFFQQDIRRLALSRRWYSLAFPTFYPRIEYTPRVISRLVNRKSKSLDKSRALLRKTLRCVNIVLEGIGPLGAPDLLCFNTPSNLGRFCLMLLEFRELKAVRFAARWQNLEWRADPLQADYLHIRSLEPYISLLTNVTSLDLDLCGTDIVDDSGALHFCPYIRPLLSRLHALRLRMRCICHCALRPLEGHPVSLGELWLSLYLGTVSDVNPKLNATRSCMSPSSWEWTSPIDEMRARMRLLVKDMAQPKRAEMVHLAPNGEVHVWDASTDVCVRDKTEKSRRFPLFRDMEFTPCFSGAVTDDWILGLTDDSEIV
ncbi:hypothetical protein VTK56DRAFT_402 [Thermocarpiscus australiensis]